MSSSGKEDSTALLLALDDYLQIRVALQPYSTMNMSPQDAGQWHRGCVGVKAPCTYQISVWRVTSERYNLRTKVVGGVLYWGDPDRSLYLFQPQKLPNFLTLVYLIALCLLCSRINLSVFINILRQDFIACIGAQNQYIKLIGNLRQSVGGKL